MPMERQSRVKLSHMSGNAQVSTYFWQRGVSYKPPINNWVLPPDNKQRAGLNNIQHVTAGNQHDGICVCVCVCVCVVSVSVYINSV